jgi:hypothetical protein
MPLIQAAQQHLEYARRATAIIGPLPTGNELAQVIDAGMHELLWTQRQRIALVPVPAAASAIGTAPPASVVYITDADTARATEDQAVAVYDSRSPAVHIDAMTAFLAILWLFTLALPPVVVLDLPSEAQSIIVGYVAAVGLMPVIHWRVSDKRKHD